MLNRTKESWPRLLGRRALGFVAGAVLVLGASVSYAQITGTKHNLGTGGTGANHLTAGTAEICVFCHTPHASNTNVKAPLWNKTTNAGTYTLYDTAISTTIDGQVDMKGVSLACLSCHDGSQAMDVMINAPGSGGYNAAGARLAGATWTAAAEALLGKMPTGVANLSTDLSNDHPVGIQYCGGGWSAATSTASGAGGTCKDPDFHAPATGTIGGATAWWVDSSVGTAAREKTDMILYARAPTDFAGNFQPFVECASCHDPHSANPTFLRIQNTGSAVCLTCHNK